MIDHELVKQLTDAGFPSSPYHLSELIESFGERIRMLYKTADTEDGGDEWRATDLGYALGVSEPSVGKTTSEAVAKLWLALNKNDETNDN